MTTSDATSSTRLDGLDLARFLAFAGMVIVNFRLVVSGDSPPDASTLDYLISLLEGKAAATFVVLAGVGLGLAGQRNDLDHTIFITGKRAAFLLVIGLLNMLMFDADILHYYAFYFLIGALLLPCTNRSLVMTIVLLNILSVILVFALDYDAGWNWTDFSYSGFWTPTGFIRNLFFNGWHPVIPWLSYLLLGILLSRLALSSRNTQYSLITIGTVALISAEVFSRILTPWLAAIDPELAELATTAAIPPMPLYMLAGMGAASMIVGLCLLMTAGLTRYGVLALVAPAGRQSLTLYIGHIVIGMGSLEELGLLDTHPVSTSLIASITFCALSAVYAYIWSRYFKHGPVETIMRKLAG